MRLGKHQIEWLAGMRIGAAQIVGSKLARSLVKRGLAKAHGEDGDSWISITPEGLEALASAIRSGDCEHAFTLEKVKAMKRP